MTLFTDVARHTAPIQLGQGSVDRSSAVSSLRSVVLRQPRQHRIELAEGAAELGRGLGLALILLQAAFANCV